MPSGYTYSHIFKGFSLIEMSISLDYTVRSAPGVATEAAGHWESWSKEP